MAPAKPQKWSELPRRGPPVRALCLGINAYANLPKLDNCERDATEFARRVENLPDGSNGRCVATVRTGAQLKSKADMAQVVREFAATIDKQAPPRMVAVTFSGHGIQEGEQILMIPSEASKEKQKEEGFSHDELF